MISLLNHYLLFNILFQVLNFKCSLQVHVPPELGIRTDSGSKHMYNCSMVSVCLQSAVYGLGELVLPPVKTEIPME